MADLKNYVMGLLTVLFVATSVVTIYSYGLTNNINNGGNGTSVDFPLVNQTVGYTAQMQNYSNGLANSTATASSQPSAGVASLGGGIGAITQAGTAAISLSFNALGILISMIGSIGLTLNSIVPGIGYIVGFGVLAVAIGIVFAILAAVFKWWI